MGETQNISGMFNAAIKQFLVTFESIQTYVLCRVSEMHSKLIFDIEKKSLCHIAYSTILNSPVSYCENILSKINVGTF
jgi:hypothetical protein